MQKNMKKYRILLSEKVCGEIEVEAKDLHSAWAKVEKMIDKNDIPSESMDDSDGYVIEDIQKIKE